jgi:hypothetical protein
VSFDELVQRLHEALAKHLIWPEMPDELAVDEVQRAQSLYGWPVIEAKKNGAVRMWIGLQWRNPCLTLALVATHGQGLEAGPELIEARPPQGRDEREGNALLVARLVHVGIVTLRRLGVPCIEVDPIAEGLRAHYTALGFEGGRRFDLTSDEHLEKAQVFIETVYQAYGIAFAPELDA